jgi:hydrogenase-4 component B
MREAPASMLAGMVFLVVACVALGLGVFLVVPGLADVALTFPGFDQASALRTGAGLFSAPLPAGLGQMSPPAIAFGLAGLIVATLVLLRFGAPRFRMRRADTWGCGRLVQTPRMQYTATAFAEPLRRVFSELYRPNEDVNVEVHPGSKYFIRAITYESDVKPVIEPLVYGPIVGAVRRLAAKVRGVQAGSVHLYLAYVCAALIALLLAARWLP